MFRHLMFPVVAVTLTASLTGCARQELQLTPREYELMPDILKESPTLRTQYVVKCAEAIQRERPPNLETAVFLKIPVERVPTVVCERLIQAVAVGKITYADAQAMQENRAPPTLRTLILEIMLSDAGEAI